MLSRTACRHAAGQDQTTAARGSPDNELDLAERGTATRRQPAGRIRQRCDGNGRNLTGREQRRGDDKISAAEGILEALAEKGDGARVAGIGGIDVQRDVQMRTGGEQAQQPDREGAQHSHATQGAGDWAGRRVGYGRQVGKR